MTYKILLMTYKILFMTYKILFMTYKILFIQATTLDTTRFRKPLKYLKVFKSILLKYFTLVQQSKKNKKKIKKGVREPLLTFYYAVAYAPLLNSKHLVKELFRKLIALNNPLLQSF